MIKLRYPVNFIYISQEYKNNHKALDLGWSKSYGGKNQNIYAAYDGVVTNVIDGKHKDLSSRNNAGNLITIKHKDNLETRYIHLQKGSIVVKKGQSVKTGEKIAKMGDSGYTIGNHLHYNVYLNKKAVNPILYAYIYEDQILSPSTQNKYGSLLKRYETKDIIYTVKKGDTLSHIAKRYNTTYQMLAKYNNISNPHFIKVGQKIKIPNINEITYIVKMGDTLSHIANKYNTTYQKLANYNNIKNSNLIFIGQKIKIPKE